MSENEKYRIPDYETLTISSDFMFAKVMGNEKLCRKLLETIFGRKIRKIEYLELQKPIRPAITQKGVRLDVYVEDDENTVFNVEMQATNPGNLPKRSRYYQGMIDLNAVMRGGDYRELRDSYVVFICTSDIFDKKTAKSRHVYTFEERCVQDQGLRLGDGSTKMFLNPVSDADDIKPELTRFLRYVTGGAPEDEFTLEIDAEVQKARTNEEWRAEYMGLMATQMEKYHDGLKEGRAEGIAQGRVEGGDAVSKLIEHFVRLKQFDEVERISADKEYRMKMLKTMNLL